MKTLAVALLLLISFIPGITGQEIQLQDDSLSKENLTSVQLMHYYHKLASLDSAAGHWERAFANKRLYKIQKDSVFNDETEKKLFEAQVQYEFATKEDSLRYQNALSKEKLTHQNLRVAQQHQTLLFHDQELEILRKEKELQDLALAKSQIEIEVEKSQSARQQDQIILMTKAGEVNTMEAERQRRTKNFLLAGIILLCITIALIYYAFITRQQLHLQQLRNKIASDLNEDVGSTLSSISLFSEMARKESSQAIPMLDAIGESSQKMLDAMSDIVWTINPENDDLEKILDRMRSFAYELLGAKKIDFEFEADTSLHKLRLPMEARKNLYLIFKEATNNMVKYAEANKAHFAVQMDRGHLTMLIQDNGKGFDPNLQSSGNGLRNMRKRAEEIGGALRINMVRCPRSI